jgi:hypothetical protein
VVVVRPDQRSPDAERGGNGSALNGQDGRSLFKGDPFLLMASFRAGHEWKNTENLPVASGQGQPTVGADRVLGPSGLGTNDVGQGPADPRVVVVPPKARMCPCWPSITTGSPGSSAARARFLWALSPAERRCPHGLCVRV